jgi:hypothetical protein
MVSLLSGKKEDLKTVDKLLKRLKNNLIYRGLNPGGKPGK